MNILIFIKYASLPLWFWYMWKINLEDTGKSNRTKPRWKQTKWESHSYYSWYNVHVPCAWTNARQTTDSQLLPRGVRDIGKHNADYRLRHVCSQIEFFVGYRDKVVSLIAGFMGPTWGLPGASRTQVGPIGATWTLLSGLNWTSGSGEISKCK